MSTYYRPTSPIDPGAIRRVCGVVLEDCEHAGYAYQITDEQRSGYVLVVTNARGLVIELRRFGNNFDFADRALQVLSDGLGTKIVSNYEPEFQQLDHRTPEEIAAAPKRKTVRLF